MISVIICAHNPKPHIFEIVLGALQKQTLAHSMWELLLIDNASHPAIVEMADLSWHPNSKVIVEDKLGLSHARLRGVNESKNELIVFVDDDNVLQEDYLQVSLNFHQLHPEVGCFGGKSLPLFETQPPAWFFETNINLGCQDYGDQLYISNYQTSNEPLTNYPSFAPIGTGMVITKAAFLNYTNEVENDVQRMALGRKGKALTSGEDNDIIITIVKHGFEIAYVPTLQLEHLIPPVRYTKAYLKRIAFEANRSWVKVLNMHQLSSWKPITSFSLPLRQFKAYLKLRAWKSIPNAINYRAACGILKGQSEIS